MGRRPWKPWERGFSGANENVCWISINGGENIESCQCIFLAKFGRERKKTDKIVAGDGRGKEGLLFQKRA